MLSFGFLFLDFFKSCSSSCNTYQVVSLFTVSDTTDSFMSTCRWTQIFYGREDLDKEPELTRATSYDPGSHYDTGIFSWIFAVFRIKYAERWNAC